MTRSSSRRGGRGAKAGGAGAEAEVATSSQGSTSFKLCVISRTSRFPRSAVLAAFLLSAMPPAMLQINGKAVPREAARAEPGHVPSGAQRKIRRHTGRRGAFMRKIARRINLQEILNNEKSQEQARLSTRHRRAAASPMACSQV